MQQRPVKHVPERSDVLNMHWPPKPAEIARHQHGIPVRVRIVWADDGEEYADGVATRWDARHVYVEVRDTRLRGNGVWVKPGDVYRRSPDT
jgi:hypothetical protein